MDTSDYFRELGLDPGRAQALAALARVRELGIGEVAVEAGRLAPLTVIVEGLVEGLVEGRGEGAARGGRLGPGELLGARSHLLGEAEPTTMVASAPSRLACLSAELVEGLDGPSREALDGAVLRYLRGLRRESEGQTIALVAGAGGAPFLGPFADALREALSDLGQSPAVVQARALADPQWRAWLAELRQVHGQVVIVCEDPAALDAVGAWPTDLTLVVVDGAARPRRGGSWTARSGRTELALIQPEARGPHGGATRWLRAFPWVHGHHHVCLCAPRSVSRLARRVSGTATNLVLGAGGARGFAHIGVHRALVEAGVEIDFVAGSSIGAILGALIAHDWEPEAIEAAARRLFLAGPSIFDVHLSSLSLVAGERMAKGLREVFGEVALEALPLGFACVTTDVVEMRSVVHERGSLWKLCKASGSMPGVAPPVRVDGRVLIDGGVLNCLPLDIPRARHGGETLAVNVIPRRPSRRFASYDDVRARGWGRRSLQGSGVHGIHGLDLLQRSMQARAVEDLRARSQGTERWLEPPLEGVGVFQRKRFDEIVERGYAYAKGELAAGTGLGPQTEEGVLFA